MNKTSVSSLEARIQEQAQVFAREVVAALRSAPLSDLAVLSGAVPTIISAPQVTPGDTGLTPTGRKKRKMTNYPKCHWGSCQKNMSPRTRPYCGEHNRKVKAGIQPPKSSGPKTAS